MIFSVFSHYLSFLQELKLRAFAKKVRVSCLPFLILDWHCSFSYHTYSNRSRPWLSTALKKVPHLGQKTLIRTTPPPLPLNKCLGPDIIKIKGSQNNSLICTRALVLVNTVSFILKSMSLYITGLCQRTCQMESNSWRSIWVWPW